MMLAHYENIVISGTGTVDVDAFCRVASHFLENEDEEALQKELKEAFRLYDKEGNFENSERVWLIFQKWRRTVDRCDLSHYGFDPENGFIFFDIISANFQLHQD